MLPVAGPGNERLIFNEYVLVTRNPFPTRLARVKRSLFTIRYPPSAIRHPPFTFSLRTRGTN
jgi:hypothetical protein